MFLHKLFLKFQRTKKMWENGGKAGLYNFKNAVFNKLIPVSLVDENTEQMSSDWQFAY